MLTRQESTDRLLEMGLDCPSLTALLTAIESVNKTGYGTVTLNFQDGQVSLWRAETTGKPIRR